MSRIASRQKAVLAAALTVVVLAGCDDGGSSSGGNSRPDPPFTKVKVRGDCPGFMAVGLPLVFTLRVTNDGAENWPATYAATEDLDPFVINGVSLDGVRGSDAGSPLFDSWELPGLKAGEAGKLRVALTPKDAGNTDIQFFLWGDKKGTRTVEGDSLYGCEDLAIQP